MTKEKETVLKVLGDTVTSNNSQLEQLQNDIVGPDGEVLVPSIKNENTRILNDFNTVIEQLDAAVLDTIKQANDLINAKINAYRNRVNSGVRSDRAWSTKTNYRGSGINKVAVASTTIDTYTAGIRTEYLYAIEWHDYSYNLDFPYEARSGVTTEGVTKVETFVGITTVNVGFGSLGSNNQTHSAGEEVTLYDKVGITTLEYTGGLTVTGVGSTGGSFTSVDNLTFPNTYLAANNELIAVVGVAGTFVGFGIDGEYRGMEGSDVVAHADGTEFDVLKIKTGISSLTHDYPQSLDPAIYIDDYSGTTGVGNTFLSLLDGSTVEPKKYLKIETVNTEVGLSTGDYIGVGTEMFYVTGIGTTVSSVSSITVGVGTFIKIARSVPVVYNIGSESFPSEFTGFNLKSSMNSYQSAIDRGVSQSTIDSFDDAVTEAVSAASTASTLANSRSDLVEGLNALRYERLTYKIRDVAFQIQENDTLKENARVSAAATFLVNPRYTSYLY